VGIIRGIFSGDAYADPFYSQTPDGKLMPANVGDFFGVARVDGFRPVTELKAAMKVMADLTAILEEVGARHRPADGGGESIPAISPHFTLRQKIQHHVRRKALILRCPGEMSVVEYLRTG
jgi:hypothetical protein